MKLHACEKIWSSMKNLNKDMFFLQKEPFVDAFRALKEQRNVVGCYLC